MVMQQDRILCLTISKENSCFSRISIVEEEEKELVKRKYSCVMNKWKERRIELQRRGQPKSATIVILDTGRASKFVGQSKYPN
jgi:hypothetical protein